MDGYTDFSRSSLEVLVSRLVWLFITGAISEGLVQSGWNYTQLCPDDYLKAVYEGKNKKAEFKYEEALSSKPCGSKPGLQLLRESYRLDYVAALIDAFCGSGKLGEEQDFVCCACPPSCGIHQQQR